MDTIRLIVNPTSGRGFGGKAITQIQALLKDKKVPYDMVLTERPWHATELTRRAVEQGCKTVVAVGGDGTVNEVLNGLMQAKKEGLGSAAMGVIGVGRGNDFAYGVHVPHDVERDCEILAANFRKTIDVGFVAGGDYPEGRYFGNGVGIGFDAVVGFVAADMKYLSGFPSYIVAAIKTVYRYFKAPKVSIQIDDREVIYSALMISIMNGRRMGGGFMMAPEAETDDGLLDYCIAEEVGKTAVFGLIPKFMKGSQKGHPMIHMGRAKKIEITALEGALPAHADGETLCKEGAKLSIELFPAQLEMICQSS